MNQQLSFSIDPLKAFFAKHHAIVFICLLAVLLGTAVFTLYAVIEKASAPTNDNTSTIETFDQKTIDKIKNLHDSSDTAPPFKFPEKRVNPFVE